jgi:hypothetical protein
VWLEDPRRDLTIHVRGLKALDPKTYRLTASADVAACAETDAQQWQKGLRLLDLTARANIALTVHVECDVAVRLGTRERPVGLTLEPHVKDLKLQLKDFDLKRVTLNRAGLAVEGEAVEGVGEEFQDALQALLQAAEPGARKRANEALARGLKGGKGPLTPAALLKAAAPLLRTGEPSPGK